MSKALQIIEHSKNPAKSTLGHFLERPTDKKLRDCIKNEIQRNIYISAFIDLELMNLNFVSVSYQILAYSMELAGYFILTESAGDQYTDLRKEGVSKVKDERINPKLVLADRKLRNAQTWSKLLGLDPMSRQRMRMGPEAEKPIKKKGKYNFDE